MATKKSTTKKVSFLNFVKCECEHCGKERKVKMYKIDDECQLFLCNTCYKERKADDLRGTMDLIGLALAKEKEEKEKIK